MKEPKWFDLNHDGKISRMEKTLGESMMFSMIEGEDQGSRLSGTGIDSDDWDDMDDSEDD